jgi:hypothetical protein
LVGILKDKGWNSRILGKLRPEMTIWLEMAAPST